MTVNQYEIGVTDRAELLLEPFFYEWDHPKGGKNFSGVGDLEITPSYMVLLERPMLPAVVLALKIKVPTATNRDIGSGELDYYPYLIFGKRPAIGCSTRISASISSSHRTTSRCATNTSGIFLRSAA